MRSEAILSRSSCAIIILAMEDSSGTPLSFSMADTLKIHMAMR